MKRYTTTFIPLRRTILFMGSLLAAGLVLPTLLWLLSGTLAVPALAQASAKVIRVAATGSDTPSCGSVATSCRTVQYAVDAAQPGDEIRVATGIYTGVQARAGITQVVYISKTVTVRGGYTTADWDTADPKANPTTLDAQGQGRVLYITGDIAPTVEGLRITGGDAAGLGGRLWGNDAGGGVYVDQAAAIVSGCIVYSNTASTADDGWGGGLFLNRSNAMLQGNTVWSNTASTAGLGGGGGLALFSDSDATLQGNTVVSNTASTAGDGWGGGLALEFNDATLRDNEIVGNIASTVDDGNGGGLYLWDSDATLQGNTVRGNAASISSYFRTGSGGGLYLNKSDATLQGNTIIGNIAHSAYEGLGGGLYLEESNATLWGNTVVSNTASTAGSGDGGGLYLYNSHATLRGNEIVSNTASLTSPGSGGGLYLESSVATVAGNTVSGNTAGSWGYGGGMYLYYSPATLQGNTVVSNTAGTANDGKGGGLYLYYSPATLQGNMVVGNIAAMAGKGLGGGLYVMVSCPFTLTNNLIAGNHANTDGSGLWLGGLTWPSSGRLLHTTIADNHGGGQGVYVGENTTLVLTNTIIAGHASVGITVTAGSTATLEATLWNGNGVDTDGDGTILTSAVNVTGDPAFVAPASWDYHLGSGSAAINAGVDAGVTADIDGESRPWPVGGDYDIGADEFVRWPDVYLPLVLR